MLFILLFSSQQMGLGVHVHWQLEVLKGVEGDVSLVHDSNDHGDVCALEGQQLDGPQVGNGTVEATGRKITRYYIDAVKTRLHK